MHPKPRGFWQLKCLMQSNVMLHFCWCVNKKTNHVSRQTNWLKDQINTVLLFLFYKLHTRLLFCFHCSDQLAQSICILHPLHYSCFANMGRFVTLKKGPKYGLKKQGATHILDLFFKVPDPKKVSGRLNKLE